MYVFLIVLSIVLVLRTALGAFDHNVHSIHTAVAEWQSDANAATDKYGHISGWDVSQVTMMDRLFKQNSLFNEDISNWKVGNVRYMRQLFCGARAFNQDISGWDVSQVTDMSLMFYGAASFNQPLNKWNVSKVTYMQQMFLGAESFNQPLYKWNVSKVTMMNSMFEKAKAFNQDISGWDVSQVTKMSALFNTASTFNQDISGWDVSKVTEMALMFYGAASFNQPLNKWDVSKVTRMNGMFYGVPSFNQPLYKWNVSSVTRMGLMFYAARAFNQDISGWDVSRVTDMQSMFNKANAFNQDISGWKPGAVTIMRYMFYQARSFNQKICWNMRTDTDVHEMLTLTDNAYVCQCSKGDDIEVIIEESGDEVCILADAFSRNWFHTIYYTWILGLISFGIWICGIFAHYKVASALLSKKPPTQASVVPLQANRYAEGQHQCKVECQEEAQELSACDILEVQVSHNYEQGEELKIPEHQNQVTMEPFMKEVSVSPGVVVTLGHAKTSLSKMMIEKEFMEKMEQDDDCENSVSNRLIQSASSQSPLQFAMISYMSVLKDTKEGSHALLNVLKNLEAEGFLYVWWDWLVIDAAEWGGRYPYSQPDFEATMIWATTHAAKVAIVWPRVSDALNYLQRPWCCSELSNAIYTKTHCIYTVEDHTNRLCVSHKDYEGGRDGPDTQELRFLKYSASVRYFAYLASLLVAAHISMIAFEDMDGLEIIGSEDHILMQMVYPGLLAFSYGIALLFFFLKVVLFVQNALGVDYTINGANLRHPMQVVSWFKAMEREKIPKHRAMEKVQRSGHLRGAIYNLGDSIACAAQISNTNDQDYKARFTFAQGTLKMVQRMWSTFRCRISLYPLPSSVPCFLSLHNEKDCLETRNPRPIGANASWLNAKDGSDEWSKIPCTQEGFSGKPILFWSSVMPSVSSPSPADDANGCGMCWRPTNNVRLIYALFYGDLNAIEPLSIFWFLYCVMSLIFIVAFVSSIAPGSESVTSYLPPGITHTDRGYREYTFNAKLQRNEYVQSNVLFYSSIYIPVFSFWSLLPLCLLSVGRLTFVSDFKTRRIYEFEGAVVLMSCLFLQVAMLVASLKGLSDIVNGVENAWIYFTYKDFDATYPLLATGTKIEIETYDTDIWTRSVVWWAVSIALTTLVLIIYIYVKYSTAMVIL